MDKNLVKALLSILGIGIVYMIVNRKINYVRKSSTISRKKVDLIVEALIDLDKIDTTDKNIVSTYENLFTLLGLVIKLDAHNRIIIVDDHGKYQNHISHYYAARKRYMDSISNKEK